MDQKEALEYFGLEAYDYDEVHKRFKLLANIYHPNGIDGGEFPLMHKINDAFLVLWREHVNKRV